MPTRPLLGLLSLSLLITACQQTPDVTSTQLTQATKKSALNAQAGPTVNRLTHSDFDGDGKSDRAVFRPDIGENNTTDNWFVQNSATNTATVMHWGMKGDKPVPCDYTGDGKTDIAVYRPSNGTYYIYRASLAPQIVTFPGVNENDVAVPGDFNGDGKCDAAVWRSSGGVLLIDGQTTQALGNAGDVPFALHLDADAQAELTVYSPSTGTWQARKSGGGFIGVQLGSSGDQPLPADYDGDGLDDFAVRSTRNPISSLQSQWYVYSSATGQLTTPSWGLLTDAAVGLDVEGDGKAEPTVYREEEGNWWSLLSSTNSQLAAQFGNDMHDVATGQDRTPSTPTDLSARPVIYHQSAKVTLSWTRVPRATSYLVQRSHSQGGPFEYRVTTAATSWTDITVAQGDSYVYRVVALTDIGPSQPASTSVNIPIQICPESPLPWCPVMQGIEPIPPNCCPEV